MEIQTSHNEPELATLVDQLEQAKHAEKLATAVRIDAERKLLPFLDTKCDGSKSTKVGDGRSVTVKTGYSWSFDRDAYKAYKHLIPESMNPIQMREVLSEPMLRMLQDKDPEAWKAVCHIFTQKPKKPYVTINGEKF